MNAIIDKSDDMKNVFNTNLILDKNKLQKDQISALHRQLEVKEEEI